MTSLNRRSNIFDDSLITPEKVKKYRDASVLATPKDNDFNLGLKKRRMSVPNIRDFSTPLKHQTNKAFLSAKLEVKSRSLEMQKENISSPILRNINTNIIEFREVQESSREYDNSLFPEVIQKEVSTQNDFIEVQDSMIQTDITKPMQDMEASTDFQPLGINQATQIEVEEEETKETEESIKQRIEAAYREQLDSQKRQILQLQELLGFKEDELSQVRNQMKTLKMSFLGQLSNLRDQLAQVKSEQYNNKKNIDWSLKETIQFLIELISSNVKDYVHQRDEKTRDNLLMYKLQVSDLRGELEKFKEFVLLVVGRLKEGIAEHFEGEVKNELQKMIDDSSRGKILKLQDFFNNENISMTTDSSAAATPRNESAKKQTPRKRHHRVDPAIIEGMKYLLDHEALKNPFNSKQNLKDKLDKVLHSDELDSNLVLSTLMERSTRRTIAKSPAQSELMNSSSHQKTPAKRSAKASPEQVDDQISELGNSSKRVKKELQHYTSFIDSDGDKFLIVEEK